MNSFKYPSAWISYMVHKNYDVDPAVIVENAEAFFKAGGKKFSEYTDEELMNAEIV